MNGISKILGSPAWTGHQLNMGTLLSLNFFSGRHKIFIRKICVGPEKNGVYEVYFVRRSEKIIDGFQFHEVDAASIRLDEIVEMLPKPSSVSETKRLCEVFMFGAELTPYGL